MEKDDVKERVIRCRRWLKLCGLIGEHRYQVAACRHEVVGDYITHF
jgi:hypothetical protein